MENCQKTQEGGIFEQSPKDSHKGVPMGGLEKSGGGGSDIRVLKEGHAQRSFDVRGKEKAAMRSRRRGTLHFELLGKRSATWAHKRNEDIDKLKANGERNRHRD